MRVTITANRLYSKNSSGCDIRPAYWRKPVMTPFEPSMTFQAITRNRKLVQKGIRRRARKSPALGPARKARKYATGKAMMVAAVATAKAIPTDVPKSRKYVGFPVSARY